MTHTEGCMCDTCIKNRVRDRVSRQVSEAAQKAYERRRGAPIGSISVREALNEKRR